MENVSIGYWKSVWIEFVKDKMAFISLLLIIVLGFIAVFQSYIAGNKPILLIDNGEIYFPSTINYPEFTGTDFKNKYEDNSSGFAIFPPIKFSPTENDLNAILEPPSSTHLFGTDDRGRDVLSRMVYGTRISLSIGFLAVGISAIIGIILGAIAGFYGGTIDFVISRLFEIMMTFPVFFLILTILAFSNPSIYNIMIVIGLTSWTGIARLVRGEFLKLRNFTYVDGARVLGSSDFRIIIRHILPNSLAPVLVSATFGIAGAILVESGLSFLGFGVPPPEPSWGDTLSQSQKYVDFAWWLVLFPGLLIFLTVTSLNLVGEGFRNAIDPKLKDT